MFCRQKGVHEILLWKGDQGIECGIMPQEKSSKQLIGL